MSNDQPGDPTSSGSDGLPIALLNRGNLKDQIAGVLRTEILAGRMKPGTTYKMGELAERFGASRTPIREAILELEAKGLVEITRGVGFRVSIPSAQELRDNLQVREMLEAPAMASVAGKLTPTELSTARALVDDIHDAAVANDLVRYLDCDRKFHLFLMERTGNRRLVTIVGELRDVQRVPGLARMANDGNLMTRNEDHVGMLDAIEAGDAEQVAALVKHHLSLSQLAWATDAAEPAPSA